MMSAVNLAGTPRNKPADRLCEHNGPDYLGASKANDILLSDSTKKSLKVSEWAGCNRENPSLKLDLLAALIDVDDEAVIKALLECVQEKGAVQ